MNSRNAMVKPAHRLRSRVKPTAGHHVRRRFHTTKSAEETNRSLRAFATQHGKSQLVLIDCPWSMGTSANNTSSVIPEAHYPTMSPAALLDVDLDLVCEKDCVIGFWALNGHTTLAYAILKRYGFTVITSVTWLKLREKGGVAFIPTGGPSMHVSEIFLIARRGRGLPISKTAERFRSVMSLPRAGHSTKPPIFREILARLYPMTREGKRVKRVELFARERTPGWRAWGNQAPEQVGAAPRALKKAA